MIRSEHRTWLSSVAFLDVVGFSKCSIEDQLSIKTHLDSLLRDHLQEVSRDDYILLDRGDGAAVCFLVEPETAFFFAVHLRDALVADHARQPIYQIRIGINLGPIKIIRDVNGDRAPVGEGINCAARVMDFAGPNEVLVARSFYDVIGCQSQEYAALFSYVGVRADKHVREFELYEVVPPGAQRQAAPAFAGRFKAPAPASTSVTSAFEPALLDRFRRAFTRAVGPMADVLMTRAIHRSTTEDELLDCLASALHDPHQREVFFTLVGRSVPVDAHPSTDYPPPVGVSGSGASPGPIDEDMREQARLLLVRHLGPIATILVDKAAVGAGDAREFIEQLAGKLPHGGKRNEFIDAMSSLLALRHDTTREDSD